MQASVCPRRTKGKAGRANAQSVLRARVLSSPHHRVPLGCFVQGHTTYAGLKRKDVTRCTAVANRNLRAAKVLSSTRRNAARATWVDSARRPSAYTVVVCRCVVSESADHERCRVSGAFRRLVVASCSQERKQDDGAKEILYAACGACGPRRTSTVVGGLSAAADGCAARLCLKTS